RQPFVQAPVAYNAGTGCALFGTYRGWTPAMIQSLYPTHEAYVADTKKAAALDAKAASLVPADATAAIARAEPSTAPWTPGSCPASGSCARASADSSQLARAERAGTVARPQARSRSAQSALVSASVSSRQRRPSSSWT